MARQKIEVRVKDWRVALFMGFLLGVVASSSPQYIGLIVLLVAGCGALILVSKGRI
jgi:F0F1-type ATP synthase assembly protein I